MDRTERQKNSDILTRLLKRIGQGEDPGSLRKEATRLAPVIHPTDFATAKRNLIRAGYSAHLVRQLSSAFMLLGLLEDQGAAIKAKLPENHVLKMVMAEHDLVRCFISDLQQLADRIDKLDNMTDVDTHFRRLSHIVEHLDGMEEHIQREEDVIFPYLKKHGWASLCATAQSEHVYIRVAVTDMIDLISEFNNNKFAQFKAKLNSTTKYLCPLVRKHLFQEECVLYPIAIEVIKESSVWQKMKDICDEIGYCGVHL
ncbi:MAG: hemerythrin domain-containing protein [Anaerohalosphaera sp.]|nr:hemerythrin domain-containing protein [Anaerohalosphaera sp.]